MDEWIWIELQHYLKFFCSLGKLVSKEDNTINYARTCISQAFLHLCKCSIIWACILLLSYLMMCIMTTHQSVHFVKDKVVKYGVLGGCWGSVILMYSVIPPVNITVLNQSVKFVLICLSSVCELACLIAPWSTGHVFFFFCPRTWDCLVISHHGWGSKNRSMQQDN